MANNLIFQYIFLIIIHAYGFSQIELPKIFSDEIVIEHSGYTVSFNKNHKQANWVAYELTKAEISGEHKRKNNFKTDPKIPGKTASPNDYKGTDYDRGHLAPAADMTWSKKAMDESFYMSNISPQYYSFNRGAWKKLEKQIRNWANAYESVYIVTGGVLSENLKRIGMDSSITVPNEYFKAVIHYNDIGMKAIGFLMPNEKIKKPISNYAIEIDSIEYVTGIDFFHQLPDSIENALESNIDVKLWLWD